MPKLYKVISGNSFKVVEIKYKGDDKKEWDQVFETVEEAIAAIKRSNDKAMVVKVEAELDAP